MKLVQYGDPLISSKENRSRVGILTPGRYHGFNVFAPRDPLPGVDKYYIQVYHGDSNNGGFMVANTSNSLNRLGFLITRHGVIFSSEADDAATGIALDIAVNSTEANVFHIFIARHVWIDAEGGSEVEFETRVWVPSDPTNPDPSSYTGLGDTEITLGYFKILPGAVDYAKVFLYAQARPFFAGNPDDESHLAKLFENNLFRKVNSNVISEGYSYNGGTSTLTLDPVVSNIYKIAHPLVMAIENISWGGADGSLLTLIMDGAAVASFNPGGNILTPNYLRIHPSSVFIFLKVAGSYIPVAATVTLLRDINNIYVPTPPIWGPWQNLSIDPAGVPAKMKVGNTSGGESTLVVKYRWDGRGAFVIRAKFQLTGSISSGENFTIMSSEPIPLLGLDSSHFNDPITGSIYGSLGNGGALIISTSSLVIRMIGANGVGSYYSEEILVSPCSA